MLIFAIISIPALFVILQKDFTSKKIVLFVWGIIISSLVSAIMWSVGTLNVSYTDNFISKISNIFIVELVPLITIFIYIIITSSSKRNIKKITLEFFSGYLYWNLMFSLLIDVRIYNKIQVILLPLSFLLIIYIYSVLNRAEFKNNDKVIRVIILCLMPLIIFSVQILSIISTSLAFVFIFLILIICLMIKTNIGNLKEKILLNEN